MQDTLAGLFSKARDKIVEMELQNSVVILQRVERWFQNGVSVVVIVIVACSRPKKIILSNRWLSNELTNYHSVMLCMHITWVDYIYCSTKVYI